jgi:anti-anti-sigma regulatory factor
MLTVTVENRGESTTLHCFGRIVRGNETAILCSAVHQEGRDVVLDLALVEAVDAAGIGALVSLQAAEQVKEIFKATRLASIFEIRESRSSAGTTESTQAGLPDNESQRLCAPQV